MSTIALERWYRITIWLCVLGLGMTWWSVFIAANYKAALFYHVACWLLWWPMKQSRDELERRGV